MRSLPRGLGRLLFLVCGVAGAASGSAQDYTAAVAAIKPSVVAVGTFQRLRSPPFAFRGTGFAVADGRRIVTNAHVLPASVDSANREVLAILIPAGEGQAQAREVKEVARDQGRDLAVLLLDGDPLPPLRIGDSSKVREGATFLITGFPLGAVLGPQPSTHRVMVAAIPPLVMPAEQSTRLDVAAIRQLAAGAFRVFQLDGTALPGNSGSPLIDPETRAVMGVINSTVVNRTREGANGAPAGIAFAIPAENLVRLLGTAGMPGQ